MRHNSFARCIALLLTLYCAGTARAQNAGGFDGDFLPKTMRLDYFHTGGKGQEIIAVDRVVSDGAWAGSRTQLIDNTNLGAYQFEIADAATNRVLYSRGYASIYGEWETTAEPRTAHRTFHESLRFPWPKRSVRVSIKRRDERNAFKEIWTTTVDPSARTVNRADPRPQGEVFTVFENGDPAKKVDLLILGEGYTQAELGKFRSDVKRLVDTLFATQPFRARKSDFNVRAMAVIAGEKGVTRPHGQRFRRTPLSAEYNALGLERYILTTDNRALRDAASSAPYEFLAIFVNDDQYGGGGIFSDHSTVAVDSDFAPYVFIHEFGHHFAALADEYYTSDVPYTTGVTDRPEPWEPNITALRDPATLKWRDLVTPGTPLPTPWNKEEFEALGRRFAQRRRELVQRNAPAADMDRLFREQRSAERAFFAKLRYRDRVGAFEGASYEAKGLYRPEVDCIMFSRNPVDFCDVCRRAIERVIALYAG